MIRLLLAIAALFLATPAWATVLEFRPDGETVRHESLDYLERQRTGDTDTKGLYDLYAAAASVTQRVDEDLIRAVIHAESFYRANAVSPRGAEGLMQLMPDTADRFHVDDAFSPAENIRGGTSYLASLLHRYGGNEELAVAAYNAGEGAVDKYHGIPPFQETADYLRRVKSYLRRPFRTRQSAILDSEELR